jgi:NAD(P)-dependent dehydrogenase (short-subunit alcohol dehydrogenase family)
MPMDTPIRNAFVTGASSGIGRAVTLKLLQEGFEVWGTARSLARLDSFQNEPKFHPVGLDLDHPDQATLAYAQAYAASVGGFEVVVNNAGYGVFEPFDTTPFEVWERQLQAMLLTTLRVMQRQVVDLKLRGSGVLVNVASMATEFPLPYMSGYNVAKAGLSAMSESLLIELAKTQVRVIDFRPGDFRTDFNVAMTRNSPDPTTRSTTPRMDAAWVAVEANFDSSPEVELAANDLFQAIQTGRQGVVRTGDFFQTRLAPLFERLIPLSWARAVRWRYFGLK